MTQLDIDSPHGPVPSFVAEPNTAGSWPGVVVVHDALGMTEDVKNHARFFARAGYLAAAPNLYHRGGRMRCLVRTMRDAARGVGPAFDDIEAVRSYLAGHPHSTGRVGIIGFCMGGGFAIMMAVRPGYSAAAVNYGTLPDARWGELAHACPIVGSFGADDPTLRGMSARLSATLAQYGVAHDVKQYEGVGHGFMNQHPSSDGNWLFSLLSWASNTHYDAPASEDAQQRILAFFAAHLRN